MSSIRRKHFLVPFLAMVAMLVPGCGYNAMQGGDETVKASWAEVLNQYKRRADLIPNLVKTVEGFAQQERDVLIQVTEARSRVGSVQATPETLKVARTVADLAGSEVIAVAHVAEALQAQRALG